MKVKRALWKFPFTEIKKSYYKVLDNTYKVYNRNLTITSDLLNKQVRCHKGKVVGKLLITKQHIGYKLGAFFVTKILGDRISYRKFLKQKAKRARKKKGAKK